MDLFPTAFFSQVNFTKGLQVITHYVLLSDIHGNYTALQAVLKDIAQRYGSENHLLCLGDLVGYGPQPIEVLECVMARFNFCLLGNHDQAVIFEPDDFNSRAVEAIRWTRQQIDSSKESARYYEYLASLPTFRRVEDMLFVHGSPRQVTSEYIMPNCASNRKQMGEVFERIDHFAFAGHTHQAGVFCFGADRMEFAAEESIVGSYCFEKGLRYLMNVGSVGQPRDGNPLACYCVFSGDKVSFHRVEYDIDEVADAIRAIPSLHNSLAERLYEGH